jgi:lipopolysaccharide/colanic/teichoic acid biosynthesis glycosyltransferase
MGRLVKPFLTMREGESLRLPFPPFGEKRAGGRRPGDAIRMRATTKRMVDVTVAFAFLVLLAVPLLLIALAVKLDSPGPVFYRVRRVGHRGRPLTMLKFRKMHDRASGIPLTANADPRLTRIGALLVRTRLDELPQLWDVLRGRMSIVGPRPEDPEFVALHGDAYQHILSVRPGITGLSQLAFAEEHSILDPSDLVGDYVDRILPQKVGLDTLYAREYGLRMDLKVLTWTMAAMLLRKRVSVHRRTGALTLRRRPRPPALVSPGEAAVVTVPRASGVRSEPVAAERAQAA